ncbi:MAG: 3',5'-cyclic-nucleotide phosphodiesterase, partial [Planctomycetes bacterium]|nr:3',5'-cyclic-nucleotide phosphodiesterase [Planctomycetota bacterium]
AKFASELRKLRSDVEVVVVHIKPSFRESILAELRELATPRLQIGVPGRDYEF